IRSIRKAGSIRWIALSERDVKQWRRSRVELASCPEVAIHLQPTVSLRAVGSTEPEARPPGRFGNRPSLSRLSILRAFNSELETEDRLARQAEPLPPGQLGKLTKVYRELLEAIGEDSTRQGLVQTPARAARALEFLTQGYRQSVEEIVNNAIFDSEASEIILVKDTE